MKEISKKERFRQEKEKAKLKKRIIFWTIIIIFFGGLTYWITQSAKNSPSFTDPSVDSNEVPSGQIHWHPNLEIKIDGESITIPNNIGIEPGSHSPTHTHDEGDGTIHLENSNPKAQPETMAVGYFFNLWKKPFNETCVLDRCESNDGGELHMYVNGEENFEFEKYVFKGEDKILIEYTS